MRNLLLEYQFSSIRVQLPTMPPSSARFHVIPFASS
jgi:hypothetical protein